MYPLYGSQYGPYVPLQYVPVEVTISTMDAHRYIYADLSAMPFRFGWPMLLAPVLCSTVCTFSFFFPCVAIAGMGSSDHR